MSAVVTDYRNSLADGIYPTTVTTSDASLPDQRKHKKIEGQNHYHGWVDGCIAGSNPATVSTTAGHSPRLCF